MVILRINTYNLQIMFRRIPEQFGGIQLNMTYVDHQEISWIVTFDPCGPLRGQQVA